MVHGALLYRVQVDGHNAKNIYTKLFWLWNLYLEVIKPISITGNSISAFLTVYHLIDAESSLAKIAESLLVEHFLSTC